MVTMTKEYNKKYYEEHKYMYKTKYNVSITCSVCGAVIKKKNLCRHQRSKKCKTFSKLKSI